LPTRYERGRSAENYVKQKLLRKGATLVIRSGRSLTDFDLIAFFPLTREIELIQVKTGKKGLKLHQVAKDYPHIKHFDGVWTVCTGFYVRTEKGWASDLHF